MKPTVKISKTLIKRKAATAVLITASLAAFATLGDGGRKQTTSSKSLLTHSYNHDFSTFSLKSGYNYRGNSLFNAPAEEKKYIMLNTVVTYQKGNSTYILPMKKKVLLDKITFKPSAKTF